MGAQESADVIQDGYVLFTTKRQRKNASCGNMLCIAPDSGKCPSGGDLATGFVSFRRLILLLCVLNDCHCQIFYN